MKYCLVLITLSLLGLAYSEENTSRCYNGSLERILSDNCKTKTTANKRAVHTIDDIKELKPSNTRTLSGKTESFELVTVEADCKKDGSFANREDCRLFFMCSNGRRYDFKCPSELYFDEILNICNWPLLVKCNKGSNDTPTTLIPTPTTSIDANANNDGDTTTQPNSTTDETSELVSTTSDDENNDQPTTKSPNITHQPTETITTTDGDEGNEDQTTTLPNSTDEPATSDQNENSDNDNTEINSTTEESTEIVQTTFSDGENNNEPSTKSPNITNQPTEIIPTDSPGITDEPSETDPPTSDGNDGEIVTTQPNSTTDVTSEIVPTTSNDDEDNDQPTTKSPNVTNHPTEIIPTTEYEPLETMPTTNDGDNNEIPTTTSPSTRSPSSTQPTTGNDDCRMDGYFTNSNDCNKYYVCSRGRRFDFKCPDGLYFDESLSTCNWESLVNCNKGDNNTTSPPPATGNDDCRMDGYFTNSNDCNRYYVCSRGRRFDFKCPEGLHFDESLSTCNWESLVNCNKGDNNTTSPPPATGNDDCRLDGYFTNSNDCNRYYVCSRGRRFDFKCPDGLYFDESICTCNWESLVICK